MPRSPRRCRLDLLGDLVILRPPVTVPFFIPVPVLLGTFLISPIVSPITATIIVATTPGPKPWAGRPPSPRGRGAGGGGASPPPLGPPDGVNPAGADSPGVDPWRIRTPSDTYAPDVNCGGVCKLVAGVAETTSLRSGELMSKWSAVSCERPKRPGVERIPGVRAVIIVARRSWLTMPGLGRAVLTTVGGGAL